MKIRSLVLLLVFLLTACNRGATSLHVTMTDYRYTPESLTVPAGKEITLELKNEGFVSHTFIIFRKGTDAGEKYGPEDEENIYWKAELLPGRSATATFTAPTEPGEYFVTCGLGGHHEVGMIGMLVVTDK